MSIGTIVNVVDILKQRQNELRDKVEQLDKEEEELEELLQEKISEKKDCLCLIHGLDASIDLLIEKDKEG